MHKEDCNCISKLISLFLFFEYKLISLWCSAKLLLWNQTLWFDKIFQIYLLKFVSVGWMETLQEFQLSHQICQESFSFSFSFTLLFLDPYKPLLKRYTSTRNTAFFPPKLVMITVSLSVKVAG